MPDSDKALRQAVEQKAADKINGADDFLIHLVPVAILIFKGYSAIFNGQQSAIGNGNPMGVSGQIFQHLFRGLDRLSHTDHPAFVIQPLFELWVVAGKMQFPTLKNASHMFHELSAKHP